MVKSPNEIQQLPVIKLIGDIHENFYQLGVKDQEEFFSVHEHIKDIFRPNLPLIGTILESTLEELFKRQVLPFGNLTPLLESYAQGLNYPSHQLQLSLLLPELMSSLHAWLPSVKNFLMGCSSFFTVDEDSGEIIHGRILDFPLQNSYDQTERAVSYQLKGQNKVLAFGAAGVPFASITGMNDKGITLALHQKFTNIFNKNGESIFEISHKILSEATCKEDIFKMLEDMESITAWNLNIGLPNREVLEIDFLGDNYLYTEHTLAPGEILYLNNQLMERESDKQEHIPYGLDYYNLSRERAADEIIKELGSKKMNAKNLITAMGTHPMKSKKGQYPVLTPSSVTVVTMEANKGEALYIAGEAPKEISQGLLKLSNAWEDLSQSEVKITKKINDKKSDVLKAKRFLMQAQVDFDTNNFNDCYHHIQMAIDYYEDSEMKNVARFFFLVFQALLEDDKRVLANISVGFREIKDKLPGVLPDHARLFLFRLERIISSKYSVNADEISHPKIREIYHLESNLPQFMLHKIVKNSTLPRIDLLDIIYLYGKL